MNVGSVRGRQGPWVRKLVVRAASAAVLFTVSQQLDGMTVLRIRVPPEKRDLVRTVMLACDGVVDAS